FLFLFFCFGFFYLCKLKKYYNWVGGGCNWVLYFFGHNWYFGCFVVFFGGFDLFVLGAGFVVLFLVLVYLLLGYRFVTPC
ncbi:hypothetical protein NPM20_24150, partial [Vibrio parahaemolyticus]|nr:hypothetical protein [Vibrio parahaemolyticus]